MIPAIDTIPDVLQEILDLLTDPASGCQILDPQPCRVAVYPGPNAAWDSCSSDCGNGEGQLYANIVSLDVRQRDQPCLQIRYTAEVGVMRCAAPMANDGSPPSPAAVEANARLQATDAELIRRAIMCCPTRSEALEGMILLSWQALDGGGCVGGAWTVQGQIDACC